MEIKDQNIEDLRQLSGKKVLVTGASGFIGQHLCKKLLSIGASVHGTSRFHKGKDPRLRDLYWFQGTFDNPDTAKNILKRSKPEYIFHMAGNVTASNDLKHVLSTFNSLLTSTVNLLSEAVDLGCEKIILTGSSTEPENISKAPSSPYAAAKLATVTYGSLFQKLYKLPVVLLRPFMGYGPAQPKNKIIPHVITSMLNGKSPKLTNGKWQVDWIYIDDLIDGILAASVYPQVISKPLDLGSGKLTSVRQVVEKVIDVLGTNIQPSFGSIPDRFSEEPRIANVDYTFCKINWKAKTSIDNGIKKTVEWFKQNESVLKFTYLFLGLISYKLQEITQFLILNLNKIECSFTI